MRLPYINEYRDRHGKVRRYFRRPGSAQIALPGNPGSPEFQRAYSLAMAGLAAKPAKEPRSAPGSIDAVIAAYYQHNSFLALASTTRAMRRAILERFRSRYGTLRVSTLRRKDVADILGRMKPWAARNWIKTLRGLMAFAIETDVRRDDPTAGIEPPKAREGRIHTWTEDEIAQFEHVHPIGSRARLAMALLLYTGQRRSDVVRMGPQHMLRSRIAVTQQKTGRSLWVPIHPALQAILDGTSTGHLNFLIAGGGKPFTAAGFGNWFRQTCDEAGLSACSAHGLRKAACRRLAEAGCSAPEIAAISGHKSLREVQRYIEEADQARLAMAAIGRLGEQATNRQLPNRSDGTA